MQSLRDLNGRSITTLTVNDLRLATIKFDRLESIDQPITLATTTYPQIPVGINIEEIINYEISNPIVTFSIVSLAATSLTGATLSWAAIPDGITLTTVDQVYTLTGFSTIAQWNQIKRPTWNLPANYATKKPFYVRVDISYFDQGANVIKTKTYNVYDPRYFYDAKLDGVFSYAFTAVKNRPFSATMSSSSIMRIRDDVEMSTSFTLTASAQDVKFGTANLSTSVSLACTPTLLQAVTNTGLLRTYVANKENQPFLTNTPQITDPRSGTYSVVLTATNAQFGTTTASSSSTLTLTGSKETINSQIANLYFYPDWNVLSNLSITWTQKYSGTTYATRTIPINYGSNNTDIKRYTYTTVGSGTFTPNFIEKKYYQLTMLLIGGGGNANQYQGGNAGKLVSRTDVTPLNSYAFSVGNRLQSTVYTYTGGSIPAAGGTTQSGSTTYTFSNYYGATISPDTTIFTKGWGGTNSNSNWGNADKDGQVSTGLSQNQVGNIVRVYRTEYAGNGGSSLDEYGWKFGRGGNAAVSIPAYPVTRLYNSLNYYFYTTGIAGQTQSPDANTWGQGGDAPGGQGYSGAVLFYLQRRLNSDGL